MIEDTAILTNVPEYVLKRFIPICNNIICHSIYESQVQGKPQTNIDLGIGELQIFISNDSIRYKFIPSNILEKTITTTVCNKVSPIAVQLDNNLKEKIDKSYKELL